MISRTMISRTR